MIQYLAAFLLTLCLALCGWLTLHGLSRWADPQSGETKWGSIPTERVVVVERENRRRAK